jgi:hypothetical protein
MDTFIIVLVVLVGVTFLGLFLGVLYLDVTKNAQAEARRGCLKEAIELVRERADVSLYMSPPKELKLGLIRARAMHDVEMLLREKLAEADRS